MSIRYVGLSERSFYMLFCLIKIQNQLIRYLQVQVSTRNLIRNIMRLKEPWTEQNLKAIQFIYQLHLLYSLFHFPKEVVDYFTKCINSVKYKTEVWRA